jgi:hypothetical protein
LAEARSSSTTKTPADHVTDLRELVVGYAKQETVDPLKTLGHYLGFGAGGSLLVGAGCSLLLLGILRGLQTLDVFNDPAELDGGTWSFVPYMITGTVAAGMIGLAIWGVSRNAGERGRT